MTHHLSQSMTTTRQHTVDSLSKLNERLAVIDGAQKNITELASQVTSLQSVLSNKQQRGAFGQGRMEIIIQDGLPKGCYEFQYTLSEPQPARLRDLPARPAPAGDRREISARSGDRTARRARLTTSASTRPRGCAPTSPSTSPTSPTNTSSRRDPGPRADVRALGIGLSPSCTTASTTWCRRRSAPRS